MVIESYSLFIIQMKTVTLDIMNTFEDYPLGLLVSPPILLFLCLSHRFLRPISDFPVVTSDSAYIPLLAGFSVPSSGFAIPLLADFSTHTRFSSPNVRRVRILHIPLWGIIPTSFCFIQFPDVPAPTKDALDIYATYWSFIRPTSGFYMYPIFCRFLRPT